MAINYWQGKIDQVEIDNVMIYKMYISLHMGHKACSYFSIHFS